MAPRIQISFACVASLLIGAGFQPSTRRGPVYSRGFTGSDHAGELVGLIARTGPGRLPRVPAAPDSAEVERYAVVLCRAGYATRRDGARLLVGPPGTRLVRRADGFHAIPDERVPDQARRQRIVASFARYAAVLDQLVVEALA